MNIEIGVNLLKKINKIYKYILIQAIIGNAIVIVHNDYLNIIVVFYCLGVLVF
jgi:hypothetical protein